MDYRISSDIILSKNCKNDFDVQSFQFFKT